MPEARNPTDESSADKSGGPSPPYYRCVECGEKISQGDRQHGTVKAEKANHAKEHLDPGEDSSQLYQLVTSTGVIGP